ncbi:OLC1v1032270C1 [Oldenlandia corymbosa var. corymbosa]|uniref:OLC1v1032270C1 n=1 Tax=Oldenlandia corymbosa var. corymbosa TaxID=529605 RepID=A0AAV1CLE6_OLDCO|nr:OLC1v1032270C1 [Oldenlandia corymbosa var. corymbosa]
MIRKLPPFYPTIPTDSSIRTPPQLSSLLPLYKFRNLPFPSSSSSSSLSSPSSSPRTQMAATHNAAPATAVATAARRRRKMKKLVVVMGPTGSGKSKLSIDLATRFFPNSEIINSDKIQVYRGLDITTNKISMHDRRGVPHHFLGVFDPDIDFTPSDFRSLAPKTIAQIISRRNVPFVVGGSNSFIHSLLAKDFNPDIDVFEESGPVDSISSELRYECCFIWVDVSPPVLNQYLDDRVDDMLDSGMFEELSEYFAAEGFSGSSEPDSESVSRTGLRKAIGVPEFERYFKKHGGRCGESSEGDDVEERMSYEGAVKAIKDNTCKLAKRQVGKILRLRDAGWDLQRVDATEAFRAAMVTSKAGKRATEIWEKTVVEPSVKIVSRFLME